MEKHEIKDKILDFICNGMEGHKSTNTHLISQYLKIQWEDVYAFCLEMSDENNIEAVKVAGKLTYYELSITKHPNGVSFLKNGGYTQKYKKDILPEQLASSTISTNRIVKTISVLSFFVVLFSLIISIIQITKSNEISVKQLDSLKIEFRKYIQIQEKLKDSLGIYSNRNTHQDGLRKSSKK